MKKKSRRWKRDSNTTSVGFFPFLRKKYGFFPSKNSRLLLTLFVDGRRWGLPYPSCIRYMQKIKGSPKFCLKKKPSSFLKNAKDNQCQKYCCPFHLPFLFFTVYYFCATISKYFPNYLSMKFFPTTTLRQLIFPVMVQTLYFLYKFYKS